jgi:tRNA(Ser,Leu) C12 N-acetylase TAN1
LNEVHRKACKGEGCQSAITTDALQEEERVERLSKQVAFEVAQSEAEVDRDEIRQKAEELVREKSDEGDVPV